MRYIVKTSLFLILIVAGSNALAQSSEYLKIKNSRKLMKYFRYTGKHRPIISGHRGGMSAGFPENSILTFENTLKYTPAFFEIDPRLTKDSVAVLMHDATLDRTTTGKGKLSDYTYEEILKFRLKDPDGNVTNEKIPLLKDVIRWSKGKTVLNLDRKDLPLEMTQKIIEEAGNDVIMLTIHSPEQAKFYLQKYPNRMLSVHILNRASFDKYEAAGIPWKNMIAYIGPRFTPENKELLRLLHDRGVMCMISAAPSVDKLANADERSYGYREIFAQGADILESDLPIEAANALKGMR